MRIRYCPYCGSGFDATPEDGVNGYYCDECEDNMTLRVQRWRTRDGE